MPLYKYKYIKDGEEKEELKEFGNKAELYGFIRSENGSIVSVEEKKQARSFNFFTIGRRIKQEEIINFAKNMGVMIDAGLSISRAISVLQKQSKNKKFSDLLNSIYQSVNAGETFSASLEKYPNTFSQLFVSMVKAGEESGKLPESLKMITVQLEKNYQLSKKIKGAMIYPSVIISLMVVIGILLMVYMVPTLTETFKGLNIDLPLPTRIIISISDFLRNNIFFTFTGLILASGLFVSGLNTKFGKNTLDYVVLKMPMIKNMSKEVNAARTSRTLASLISSGVPIVGALETTKNVLQNHYFKDVVSKVTEKVQVGESLSSSFDLFGKDVYPLFLSEMLLVGEETGKMSEMLDNIANYYEGEVDQKTKDLSTIIEPFLMVLIGIAVGVFAVAMMLPTYSLVDAIQ
jgi:type IV pilus assembly protein PilC